MEPNYSEYELERLKNIQRNEDYLQQLGFDGKPYVAPAPRPKPVKRKKGDAEAINIEPARRSSRVANLEPVSYVEANLPSLSKRREDNGGLESSESNVVHGDLQVGTVAGVDVDVKPIKTESTATAGTCSTLNADLSYFFGSTLGTFSSSSSNSSSSAAPKRIKTENETAHKLCQPVEEYGKAAVMALSNHGQPPRFSKYVGALEWVNCVYLWVNLGGTSGYSNAFSEQGRHIMWYGGSRMHQDSKIIQRMATAAKSGADSDDKKSVLTAKNSKETVVLFVRVEGENYCCLGRLQWVAVDLLSSPVKIKWELMDYDLFCNSPHFKRVLKESGLS